MLRFFGGRGGLLQSPGWEPHTTDVLQAGVFGSRFPNSTHTLYTLVNRNGSALSGGQLVVRPQLAGGATTRYFDCYKGVELTPTVASGRAAAHGAPISGNQRQSVAVSGDQRQSVLSFDFEADGYGCVLGVSGEPSNGLKAFLQTMAEMTQQPLSSLSAEWSFLKQSPVPIAPSPRAKAAPAGMVSVPAAANFSFIAKGIEIEGDDAHGVDVQFAWEDHPQREHSRAMALPAFYMDKFPATNADYSAYLRATGYKPADAAHWLAHWHGASEPPAAIADAPVTYISLADARAYCGWRAGGARLPHTYEWQYAAQGLDGRPYPWGTTKDAANFPNLTTGTTYGGPEPVGAHSPAGDSPFGVSDLVGNVWQYTDEFQDEHTRAVLLRGGSNYRPSGSSWYFPNQIELGTHNKYFLFSDGYERAATIGVRCVKDAA
mmetsp:Transcript_49726/g.146658  ORF Transcript_49726/g.146658 Transcript_49726/m.146658 type:complete len:432 (+) Transcript_49726:1159-2454(+)